MSKIEFWDLSGVSDEQLVGALQELLASGARTEVRVVAHLAEVEERRLHLKAACSSLFDYCVRRLKLSESEAFHRITAARLARRFPLIFELLEARSIHLSALRILRDHLTDDNHRELLAAASGKSKKEVEELVAARSPRSDVATLIRKLPALPATRPALSPSSTASVAKFALSAKPCSDRAPQSAGGATPVEALAFDSNETSSPPQALTPSPVDNAGAASMQAPKPLSWVACELAASNSGGSTPAPSASGEADRAASALPRNAARRQALEPLSSARYLLRVSVSREFTEKLERVRTLMSHASPSDGLDTVLERALDLLLEKLAKQRFGQTKRSGVARTMPVLLEKLHGTSEGSRARQRAVPTIESADSVETAETPTSRRAGTPQRDSQLRESAQLGGGECRELESVRPSSSSEAEDVVRAPTATPHAKRAHREHIPNEVRRAVALRDGFQCTYCDDEGHRCPSRAFLQLHHEHAHALGGPASFDNLRLLCGSHNRLLAERDFGRAHQERILMRKSESNVEPVVGTRW